MAALASTSQGCGIISDAPDRTISTRAVPLPQSETSRSATDESQSHSRSGPNPIAEIPSPAEPSQPSFGKKLPSPPQPGNVQTGLASWYGPGFHGKTTASGEIFHQEKFTAAHRTLPWGSRVRVTNLANGKSVEVRINDRGPFGKGRIIDLSKAAAMALGMVGAGLASVRVERVFDFEKSNELVLQDNDAR
jgi:rare lipoprotein A (peptidoglycan hydrolase)